MAKNRKKKDREQLTEDIVAHLDYIQGTIDNLTTSSSRVQEEITRMVRDQIQHFEIKDRRFVAGQDLRSRIILVEEKMEKILTGKIYTNAVRDYLGSFSQIEKQAAALHLDYNDLEVDMKMLTPARQVVYQQAQTALYDSGIDAAFREPVKHMLLFQVTTGGSISDMELILTQWDNGKLAAASRSPTGAALPNLPRYASQMAHDTSFQFAGTIQGIIAQEYGLDGIHYTGPLIADSRPLCVYLINLRRDVSNKELAEILERPQLMPGRMPDTTVANFCQKRGGHRCGHLGFPVRIRANA